MSQIIDYQWPNFFLTKAKFNKNYSSKNNKNLIVKIEKFFYEKFKFTVRLFPSARACIGSILEYEGVNRKDEVFVNKWVSNCIFNTVGYFSNPSVNFKNQEIIIANNIWGLCQKIKKTKKKNKFIIDDSCDSIILNLKSLFPNKSKYEIFSLPKLIGSVAGGIVISKDKKFLNFCKKRQQQNKKFGILQSKLKFDEINKSKEIYDYRYKEATNSYSDYNSLKDIEKNLHNYDKNKKIISYRIKILKKIVDFKLDKSRIGPVILIDEKSFINLKNLNQVFLFRHKIISYKSNFSKKFLIFPVHFKISEKKFSYYLKILKLNLKKKL